MRLPLAPLLALAPLLSLFPPSVHATSDEAAPHLKQANTFLLKGSYQDAVREFTIALEKDQSYITLYKRATAYLSSGRSSAALDDFDAILGINPSFSKAHLEKAKIHLKEGNFTRARDALRAFLALVPKDESATTMLASIDTAEFSLAAARKAAKYSKWEMGVEKSTTVLAISPNLVEAREIRARCWFGEGNLDDGTGELTRLTALAPGDSNLSIQAATLSFFLLPSSQDTALSHLKQCLHYDPDSKQCRKMLKSLKGMQKDFTKLNNAMSTSKQEDAALTLLIGTTTVPGLITEFDSLLSTYYASHLSSILPSTLPSTLLLSRPRLRLYASACKANIQLGKVSKSKTYCEEALKMDPENVDGLVGKGERLMKEEAWEEAVRVLEKAFENGGRSDDDVRKRTLKAQKLLKISKAKDYYKVLGVSRDADARTIKKAYRKASKTAHPDKGGTEAKMAALNEAYEVLSNPDLKARFDNGDDPNDQQQQQQHHHHYQNPFAHHGGQPFFQHQQYQGGHGGGGFKFNF